MAEPSANITDILATCLEALETGQTTIEACQSRYPAAAQELAELLPLATAVHQAPAVTPSTAFQSQARQRLLAQLPDRPRPTSARPTLAQRLQALWQRLGQSPVARVSWATAVILLIFFLIGSGAAYAADPAVPGDALYGLDQNFEALRLSFQASPEEQVALQLTFADERLAEARVLYDAGQEQYFNTALDGYGQMIAAVVESIGTASAVNQEALNLLLDQSMAAHNAALAEMAGPAVAGDARCQGLTSHPIAARIAQQYRVTPAEVLQPFCSGAGFGEISLAYSIRTQTGAPVTEVLALRQNGQGWGQIMQEVELIAPGKSKAPGQQKEKKAPPKGGK